MDQTENTWEAEPGKAYETRLHHVLEGIPDGIEIYDLDANRPIFINTIACEIFGYTPEEFWAAQGSNEPLSFVPKEKRFPTDAFPTLAGSVQYVRYCGSRKDGALIWVGVACRFRMEGGRRICYAIFRDITKSVQEERQIRHQNERYRLLSESSDTVICDYDPEHDTMTYALSVHGKKRRTKTIQNYERYLPHSKVLDADSVSCYHALIDTLRRKPCKETAELCLNLYGDGFRWYRAHCVSIADDDGTVYCMTARIEDIDQAKKNETELVLERSRSAMLQRVINEKTVLMQEFDLAVLHRIAADSDVIPVQFENCQTLPQMMKCILRIIHPQDRKKLLTFQNPNVADILEHNDGRVTEDVRFRSPNGAYQGYHWGRISVLYTINDETAHPCAFLHLADVHEEMSAALKLRRQAQRDALTGLFNYKGFSERAQAALDKVAENPESGQHCVIAMINANAFYHTSEKYGRPLAEHMVYQMAGTLRAALRESDFCARIEGDEFIACLCGTDTEETLRERFRVLCAVLAQRNDERVQMRVCLGAARCPEDGTDLQTLLTCAETALAAARATEECNYKIYFSQTKEVEKELPDNEPQAEKKIYIRTFGYFDVFIDGRAVSFRTAKAKELFALLVDRRGGFVSAEDAIGCLWGDEPVSKLTLSRYRKVAMRLKNILAEYGVDDVLETRNGNRRVCPNRVECDLYDYLSGNSEYHRLFNGFYLTNYSWTENTMLLLRRESGEDDLSQRKE